MKKLSAISLYKDGALTGHKDGKSRNGQYVMGEEFQGENPDLLAPHDNRIWESGYVYGYKRAAEGNELDLDDPAF